MTQAGAGAAAAAAASPAPASGPTLEDENRAIIGFAKRLAALEYLGAPEEMAVLRFNYEQLSLMIEGSLKSIQEHEAKLDAVAKILHKFCKEVSPSFRQFLAAKADESEVHDIFRLRKFAGDGFSFEPDPKPNWLDELGADGVEVVITGPESGFWRIGRSFNTSPTIIPANQLTKRQIKALEETLELTVIVRSLDADPAN